MASLFLYIRPNIDCTKQVKRDFYRNFAYKGLVPVGYKHCPSIKINRIMVPVVMKWASKQSPSDLQLSNKRAGERNGRGH